MSVLGLIYLFEMLVYYLNYLHLFVYFVNLIRFGINDVDVRDIAISSLIRNHLSLSVIDGLPQITNYLEFIDRHTYLR